MTSFIISIQSRQFELFKDAIRDLKNLEKVEFLGDVLYFKIADSFNFTQLKAPRLLCLDFDKDDLLLFLTRQTRLRSLMLTAETEFIAEEYVLEILSKLPGTKIVTRETCKILYRDISRSFDIELFERVVARFTPPLNPIQNKWAKLFLGNCK